MADPSLAAWVRFTQERSLESWVHYAKKKVAVEEYHFTDVHLDELDLPEQITTGPAVARLLDNLEMHFGVRRGTGEVQLKIPLEYADTLDVELPASMQWTSATIEPPALYYFEPSLDRPTYWEEYMCPFQTAELESLQLIAIYSCWRNMEDRANDWEFSRNLWVRSAPPGHTSLPTT